MVFHLLIVHKKTDFRLCNNPFGWTNKALTALPKRHLLVLKHSENEGELNSVRRLTKPIWPAQCCSQCWQNKPSSSQCSAIDGCSTSSQQSCMPLPSELTTPTVSVIGIACIAGAENVPASRLTNNVKTTVSVFILVSLTELLPDGHAVFRRHIKFVTFLNVKGFVKRRYVNYGTVYTILCR